MSLKNSLDDLISNMLKETSTTSSGEAYDTPEAFTDCDECSDCAECEEIEIEESTYKKAAKLMLGEASYREYKGDPTSSPKTKVNKAIKNINSKLHEIEKILNQNVKLKNESGVSDKQYWRGTKNTLYNISNRMQRISEKLRKF